MVTASSLHITSLVLVKDMKVLYFLYSVTPMHSSFWFMLPSAHYSAILFPSIIRVQDKSLQFTQKFTGLVPVV